MLKKAKAEATGKPAGEGKDLSQSVLDSSRQIWLAGLGAAIAVAVVGLVVLNDGLLEHQDGTAALVEAWLVVSPA